MAHHLPPLRRIQLSDVLNTTPPVLKIKTEENVEFWKTTRSYSDLGLFLQRLNEAVVGHHLPFTPRSPSQVSFLFICGLQCATEPCIQHVNAVLAVLDELNTWIDKVPPLQTPQRFGNLAFREWGKRLEDVRHWRLFEAIFSLTSIPRVLTNCSRPRSLSNSTLQSHIFLHTSWHPLVPSYAWIMDPDTKHPSPYFYSAYRSSDSSHLSRMRNDRWLCFSSSDTSDFVGDSRMCII
jgi:hypothetical protein